VSGMHFVSIEQLLDDSLIPSLKIGVNNLTYLKIVKYASDYKTQK